MGQRTLRARIPAGPPRLDAQDYVAKLIGGALAPILAGNTQDWICSKLARNNLEVHWHQPLLDLLWSRPTRS
eukprot:6540488-Alexandrium_andersonii.AAC.1